MSRPDPHEGKTPGLGCGCDLCKQPLVEVSPVPALDTPEFEAWKTAQAYKRDDADRKFRAYGQEVGRPDFWMRG